jgi:hypothetical protein
VYSRLHIQLLDPPASARKATEITLFPAMLARVSALLAGSTVAAFSGLSIVNANSTVKEPATGIGEKFLLSLQITSLK